MDLSNFREDLQKQKDGVPIYFGKMCFIVRRFGTYESQVAEKEIRLRLFGPIHRYQEHDEQKVTAEWLCEYAIASWECVCLDGKEIPFSNREARKLFLNEEYWKSLNLFLLAASKNYEYYLYSQMEEDLESLKKP